MASCYKNSGGYQIQFNDKLGNRRTLRLGKRSKSQAMAIKLKVEDLASASISNQPIRQETAHWLNNIGLDLFNKLASVGLVKKRGQTKLECFIVSFISKGMVKESTKNTWRRARGHLVEFFGADCDMRSIDKLQAGQWYQWMISTRPRKLADNTARKSVGIARQFWKSAKDFGLVEQDPFCELSATVRGNSKKLYFVSEEETQIVLDACPNDEWRLLFALARYGGLRIPSEIRELKCSAFNLSTGRLLIHAPKTEHLEDCGNREVPVFDEVYSYLKPRLEQANSLDDYLLPKLRKLTNPLDATKANC